MKLEKYIKRVNIKRMQLAKNVLSLSIRQKLILLCKNKLMILFKYINLMNSDLKFKFYLLIALLLGGIMEIFGLAMIIPVVKIIIDPNEISSLLYRYNFQILLKI